jgi:hypothetical protein
MNNEPHTIPRIAITSIATGLLMMAFFTTMWAGIAYGSLANAIILLVVFGLIIITFISFAIYLFSISKRFPKLERQADKAEGKRAGKWFGIIFGAEGLGIFVAINIVVNLGHADLTIPVIALVVGLHFYPLAKIFKRTIDYYLATWTTVIAIIAIVLILKKVYPPANVDAFVGIGTGIATSCYGLYMIYTGRRLAKQVNSPVISI